MTKEEFAKLIDGREYPFHLTSEEQKRACDDDLLVVYGSSDDLMEVDGATRDEVGCYNGGEALISQYGRVVELPDDDELATLKKFGFGIKAIGGPGAFKIKAIWDGGNGYSWEYETAVPHATFEIVEDGEKYCRGIVIDLAEVRCG